MNKVVAVKPEDDYQLVIKFDNGKIKRFDMKPYLDKGVFRELKNRDYFRNVHIAFDTVQWEHEQDISPDTLYIEGEEIAERELAEIEMVEQGV
jgi:hypothetical protein